MVQRIVAKSAAGVRVPRWARNTSACMYECFVEEDTAYGTGVPSTGARWPRAHSGRRLAPPLPNP